MADDNDTSDHTNRLILIGLMILAIITIAGTVVSTMVEWDTDLAPAAAAIE